ncbi:unnamed protein product [Clonostachys chloroleuca]|uniref:14-3-3 domain-containing protein n=1 Tax=Clonostachys chloroleuca TaxID=1926264 RepID=A0AA35VIS9_9HYPO|nr:unnamed protein product [Clonostachys chloroleuca]
MQRDNGSHSFLAHLCEKAERYDDMVPHLKEVIGAGGELSVNERSLLAIACSRMVCTRRSSLRTILSIEQKKQPRVNEEHIATIRGYRKKIENELEIVCSDVLDLLDGSLMTRASLSSASSVTTCSFGRLLTVVSGEPQPKGH